MSEASTDMARAAAKILLDTEAVLFRPEDPFIFTSGRASPVYVDCRRLISFPAARTALMVCACCTADVALASS